MNLSRVDWKMVGVGAVALIIAAFLVIPAIFGGGGDKKASSQEGTSTSSSSSVSASQGGGSSSSSAAPTASATSSSKTLTGQAADEHAIRTVVPVWGKFTMPADGQQLSASDWTNTFSGMGEVSTDFVTHSRNRFNDLWGGAMQQGVNVTACKIESIKKESSAGNSVTYAVTTKQTMKAADPTVSGLDGDFEQKWTFTVTRDDDGQPQLSDFKNKT